MQSLAEICQSWIHEATRKGLPDDPQDLGLLGFAIVHAARCATTTRSTALARSVWACARLLTDIGLAGSDVMLRLTAERIRPSFSTLLELLDIRTLIEDHPA